MSRWKSLRQLLRGAQLRAFFAEFIGLMQMPRKILQTSRPKQLWRNPSTF
jgi:hypothetical protein